MASPRRRRPGGGRGQRPAGPRRNPTGGTYGVASVDDLTGPFAPTGNFFDVPEGFDTLTGTFTPDTSEADAAAAAAAEETRRQAAADAAELERSRRSASQTLAAAFIQWGVGAELADVIYGWLVEGRPNAQIETDIRGTEQYNQRFPGMAALIKKGMAISEEAYIQQEIGYEAALKGLPDGFMNNRAGYGQFIENGVSVREVEERVDNVHRQWENADPEFKAALQEYYGVGQAEAMAWMLDPTKAQSVLQDAQRKVEIGAYAAQAGIRLDSAAADRIAAMESVQGLNALSAGGSASLEQGMQAAGLRANADSFLAGIDQQVYSEEDAISAEFGDAAKKLESEKRSEREKARFAGASGVGRSSLSSRRGY